jgi:MFS family permease
MTRLRIAASRPRPVALIRILLLFESILYSILTPLLPHYEHALPASKSALGVLVASYCLGLVPGSLLGGWLGSRIGVRRTTQFGLTGFAVAVAAFGFGTDIVILDLLRIAQGVACGLIWGGSLAWVIGVTPADRRGATLGSVLGAASLGTMVGPLLGTVATTGTAAVFSVIGVVSLVLAGWVGLYPEPERVPVPERAAGRRRRPTSTIVLGCWMITLEAFTLGAVYVLLPLRLSHFGASEAAIGATFLVAAALSAALSPLVGHISDRFGTRLPVTAGLLASGLLIALLALPHSALVLALLSVIVLGGPMTAFMIPSASAIADESERLGIALVVASTLLNLAWALGETFGAPAAAVVSQATSDAVPLIGLGVLMLLTIWPALKAGRPAQPSTASSVTSRATSAA